MEDISPLKSHSDQSPSNRSAEYEELLEDDLIGRFREHAGEEMKVPRHRRTLKRHMCT
ncbi:hypothetical protein CJ184_007595 [Actinotignum urinale]|uniref:Uncharacterized protein n=1 Tax=Actinotignum urinale TaxID=190146 RepID=A0AAW9HZE5_9ACTO|nr:hypothetical protein [Actinotignum urinale]MDY5155389.1 hypothetical protein [Actinotignum urinale]WIK59079.1 hypothetical protein CJ184_007595 [Actinotignum urinale]